MEEEEGSKRREHNDSGFKSEEDEDDDGPMWDDCLDALQDSLGSSLSKGIAAMTIKD